jgi:hypothetical protein
MIILKNYSNQGNSMTSKKNRSTNRTPRRINRNAGGRKKGSTVDGYYIANGKITTLKKKPVFGI